MPFIELPSVDSTNNYAMQQVHKGLATHGTAYFAYEQTQGKGQRHKRWLTTPGENIILSVALSASRLQVSRQFDLSMTIALGVFDFLKMHIGSSLSIKWPNDLYWCDRKAGGILIENIIRGRDWQWAVAGIGVNLNQTRFDTSITNAVSVKQVTGETYRPAEQAKTLCACLEERYSALVRGETGTLSEQYNRVLYMRGRPVVLKKDGTAFPAIVKRVNEHGQMVVEADGEQVFNVGEIEWQPA